MWRRLLTFLKETRGNALWDISKWVFAGTISVCVIIVAFISSLPWVYVIPLILVCGIVFGVVTWTAIHSIQRFIPEPEIPLRTALEELKGVRDEVVHIFHLARLSLLGRPLDALERVTGLTKKSRILIKGDVFRDHLSASDLNRYDAPYNEDDLSNIEKEYEKRGYLENVDSAGRALFRHLYERGKRLDEVIGKIERPESSLSGFNDRNPFVVAVAELNGLVDEGNVMLDTFRVEGLFGVRPTLMDVEAYVKRVRSSVGQRALEIGANELTTFEQPWPSQDVSHIQKEMAVRGCLSGDEFDVFGRLWERVERLKQLIGTVGEKRGPERSDATLL